MAQHMDLTESYEEMRERLFSELVGHIGDGPFMGGLDQPTMLDFAVFPQLVFSYMFGLEEQLSAASYPVLKDWLARVSRHSGSGQNAGPFSVRSFDLTPTLLKLWYVE
jgi:glutathione S-transferase